MKDQVFTGRDVAEALRAAARALGLPPEALRYVILEAGRPAVGASPERQAQVAVLLDRGEATPPPRAPMESGGDPLGRLRALLRAVAEAAGIDVETEVEKQDDALQVRIRGAGAEFFLARDGAVLQALQHLLQRALAHSWPGRLQLECEGYRDLRDAALRARAQEAAAAVQADGQPRVLGALNSYERRIVHLALAETPGIRTFSVGEGAERRVTIALAEPGGGGG